MKENGMQKVWKARLLTWLLAGVLGAGMIITPSSLTAQRALAQSGLEERTMAVVGLAGAALQDAPGGRILAQLASGAVLDVYGRTANNVQLRVKTEGGVEGWVAASALVVVGAEDLPIVTSHGRAGQPIAPVTATPVTTTVAAPVTQAVAATAPLTPAGSAAPMVEARSHPGAVVSGVADVPGTRLNVRSGPGTGHTILGKAGDGEVLVIVARSLDGAWLQVVRDDLPEGAGWVANERVRIDGSVRDLPVSAAVFGVSAPAVSRPTATAPATTGAAVPTAAASIRTASGLADASASTEVTDLAGTLVFQDGRGSIFAYALGGRETRYLTSGFDPAVSHDGRKVAFLRADGIYSIQIDGSGERRLFASGELITSPKWSPDSNWVVFSRLLGKYKCWDTDRFGCVSVRELRARFPSVPPALLQNIFLSDSERVAQPNFGLVRVDADGQEYRDLAALDSAQAPDWNEAGIVYQSKAGIEVTQDRPDGATRSVQWGGWDWDPDWAANGGAIVYQSREGSHWEIFRINPDGSGQAALTRPTTTLVEQLPSNVAPAFSPDGRHIVYLSNRQQDGEAGPWRLWVMEADGSNPRPLPLEMEIDYGFGGEQVVSWGVQALDLIDRDQAMANRYDNGLRTIGDAQFREELADHVAHGAFGETHFVADRTVGKTLRHIPQKLDLARTQ
jgi:uncharacterized protein YraI